jgi:hypothetical protein
VGIRTNGDELAASDGGERCREGQRVAATRAIVDADDGLLEHGDVLR